MNLNLIERDKKVIWHPYTLLKSQKPPIIIVKGKDAYIYDEKGNKYIDAISSWWVNIHGHSHPYIAKKVAEQVKTLEHVIFAGFTHLPAVELAERLLKHLPKNQAKIFYSDDGSTAVEVALKMAIQANYNRGIKKNKIIAFKNSYHGDTFGAMSVSGRSIFTKPFNNFLFDVIFIDAPIKGKEKETFNQLSKAISNNDVCAFIFEPLVQGVAGMVMYEPNALELLIKYCKKNNVVTIADEVMTGFGRTGKFFATDYIKEKPDIFCISKGLTGGTMALGVTSCSQKIIDAFISDDPRKTFFHGHSYTANPVACAASLASLDLLEKPETWKNISRISESHSIFLRKIRNHALIKDARHLGTILAIELTTKEKTSYLNEMRNKIYDFFISKKILIRPLGNIIYLMPPYCITQDDLNVIYKAIEEFLQYQINRGG